MMYNFTIWQFNSVPVSFISFDDELDENIQRLAAELNLPSDSPYSVTGIGKSVANSFSGVIPFEIRGEIGSLDISNLPLPQIIN